MRRTPGLPAGGQGRRAVALVSVVTLVLGVHAAVSPADRAVERLAADAAAGAPDRASHHASHGDENARRGLVYSGLAPGRSPGPCRHAWEIEGDAHGRCTHGPDPAPGDHDVRVPRDAHDDGTTTTSATTSTGTIECIDDGVSGNRVQAIYAVASDRSDRFDSVAPLVHDWARAVDGAVAASAAATGGDRHVRWVTEPDCGLSVAKAVLSPAGDDSFGSTVRELSDLGFSRTDRKYLVWTDANLYCGIAQLYVDDRADPSNFNNGGVPPLFARVDNGCWGHSTSVEAHELMHMLGAVQPSAPNASAYYHCTDESDLMCYKDGSDVVMEVVCPPENEALFDCGHDDYFHTAPPSGGYLATHWNAANSSFLTAPDSPDPLPQDTTPPSAPTGLTATPEDAQISLSWNPVADADLAGYRVVRDGAVVASVTSPTWVDTAVTNGVTYSYSVVSFDTAANESSPSPSVTATPGTPPPAFATYSDTVNRPHFTRSYALETGSGSSSATVTVTSTSRKTSPETTAVKLVVVGPQGEILADAMAKGSVTVSVNLPSGVATWTVSGWDKFGFRLDITYPVP